MALSPDGKTLATIGADGEFIFLLGLEAYDDASSPSSIIATKGQFVSSLVYSPDGIFLASVGGLLPRYGVSLMAASGML